jgi:hypothetical protein
MLVTGVAASPAGAQQIQVSTPFHSVSDSFFERFGVGFGFSIPGGGKVVGLNPLGQPTPDGSIVFSQGGFGSAVPPFGGYDPGADARSGFARVGNNGNMFFNFAAGQGNTRSMISQTPTIVIPSGGSGTLIDATQQPFVTSIIPVVGGFSGLTPPYPLMRPPTISPLAQRIHEYQQTQAARAASMPVDDLPAARPLELGDDAAPPTAAVRRSSAEQGDIGVAEIRRQQAAEDESQLVEIRALIERARGVEAAGKPHVAKVYYQQAASRATGELKQDLLAKIQSLGK